MKTSELVLNFLREQGFLPQVDESNNIEFKFQMANFVFIENDDDPDFFQLLLPNIYDVTEDNRDIVLETVNKVNQSMKVAKACVVENSVWIFFETILDSTPDVSDIIPRALRILQSTQQEFYEQKIKEMAEVGRCVWNVFLGF